MYRVEVGYGPTISSGSRKSPLDLCSRAARMQPSPLPLCSAALTNSLHYSSVRTLRVNVSSLSSRVAEQLHRTVSPSASSRLRLRSAATSHQLSRVASSRHPLSTLLTNSNNESLASVAPSAPFVRRTGARRIAGAAVGRSRMRSRRARGADDRRHPSALELDAADRGARVPHVSRHARAAAGG